MALSSYLLHALALAAPQAPQSDKPFDLMVGDPAPALRVAEWVQGEPVTSFEAGQTYVVEFWATWCGPCKIAIPHLNELSKKYADRVRFVGVSVWEREGQGYKVPAFVEEMGDRMTYTVAADETVPQGGGAMAATWMEAAGRGGIPVAFVVNGAGRVAWIGHPMYIDEPLAAVVAGTWDVDEAAREYALELRLKELTGEIGRKVTKAKMKQDFAGALAIIEEALASEPALEANFGLEKYFLLLEGGRRADASTYGHRLVAEVYAKNAPRLNMLAWTIVDPQGRYENGDLALAVAAAERAVELLEGKDAATLDTLALALFRTGKVARAVELQEKALKLAEGGPLAEELGKRLEEFRKASGAGDGDDL